MTTTDSGTSDRQAELERELAELEIRQKQLKAGLAEFQHSGRRVADGLERAGGRERSLETRQAALADNVRLTQQELAGIADAIKEIRRALTEHTADKGE